MKMDNTNSVSIIPNAASIRRDYENLIDLQKRVANTIVEAAKQGRDNTSLKLTAGQCNYLTPILQELGYLVLPFPSRDDSGNLYVYLEINW